MSAALRRVLGVWLLIAAVTALYWPTALSYSLAWTDFDNRGNTHGYLIAAMSLALIYLRREELTGPLLRAAPAAYVALAALGLGWLLAYRAGIQTVHQLLLPVILWVAIYTVFGRRIARSCFFAVGFLYFALPFWGFINGALQALTITASQLFLHLIGIPARFDGNLVHIPEGTFAIEEGCSGLHFLVVGLAIAAYYGELHRDQLRHRVLLLSLAAGLALLTNWIRVSTVIAAGHLTHMQSYLVRVSHYGFGWAVFAVAMAVFFLFASRIPTRATAVHAPPRHPEARSAHGGLALVLAFAALAWAPALAWFALRGDAAAVVAPPMLARVPGWVGPFFTPSRWKPVFVGADREQLAMYRRDSAAVEWYTADYAFQRQGRKLLGYSNSILGVGEFTVLDEGTVADDSRRFVDLRLQDPQGAQSVLWYVYRIGPRAMTSGLRAQLWYAISSLTEPVDSGVVALRAKCEPDCAVAEEQLRLFVQSICDAASRFGDCQRAP